MLGRRVRLNSGPQNGVMAGESRKDLGTLLPQKMETFFRLVDRVFFSFSLPGIFLKKKYEIRNKNKPFWKNIEAKLNT